MRRFPSAMWTSSWVWRERGQERGGLNCLSHTPCVCSWERRNKKNLSHVSLSCSLSASRSLACIYLWLSCRILIYLHGVRALRALTMRCLYFVQLIKLRNRFRSTSFFIVVSLLLDGGCFLSEHCFFRERNRVRLGRWTIEQRKPSLKSHVT